VVPAGWPHVLELSRGAAAAVCSSAAPSRPIHPAVGGACKGQARGRPVGHAASASRFGIPPPPAPARSEARSRKAIGAGSPAARTHLARPTAKTRTANLDSHCSVLHRRTPGQGRLNCPGCAQPGRRCWARPNHLAVQGKGPAQLPQGHRRREPKISSGAYPARKTTAAAGNRTVAP